MTKMSLQKELYPTANCQVVMVGLNFDDCPKSDISPERNEGVQQISQNMLHETQVD